MQLLSRAGEEFPFIGRLSSKSVSDVPPSPETEEAMPQQRQQQQHQRASGLAPLEFMSRATSAGVSAIRLASSRAKRVLSELKDEIVADIMTDIGIPQQQLAAAEHTAAGPGWALPWAKSEDERHEEETRRQVLELAKEPHRFLVPPSPMEDGCDTAADVMDEEELLAAASTVMSIDSDLRELRDELVPRMLPEEEFWRRYFRALHRIELRASGCSTPPRSSSGHTSPSKASSSSSFSSPSPPLRPIDHNGTPVRCHTSPLFGAPTHKSTCSTVGGLGESPVSALSAVHAPSPLAHPSRQPELAGSAPRRSVSSNFSTLSSAQWAGVSGAPSVVPSASLSQLPPGASSDAPPPSAKHRTQWLSPPFAPLTGVSSAQCTPHAMPPLPPPHAVPSFFSFDRHGSGTPAKGVMAGADGMAAIRRSFGSMGKVFSAASLPWSGGVGGSSSSNSSSSSDSGSRRSSFEGDHEVKPEAEVEEASSAHSVAGCDSEGQDEQARGQASRSTSHSSDAGVRESWLHPCESEGSDSGRGSGRSVGEEEGDCVESSSAPRGSGLPSGLCAVPEDVHSVAPTEPVAARMVPTPLLHHLAAAVCDCDGHRTCGDLVQLSSRSAWPFSHSIGASPFSSRSHPMRPAPALAAAQATGSLSGKWTPWAAATAGAATGPKQVASSLQVPPRPFADVVAALFRPEWLESSRPETSPVALMSGVSPRPLPSPSPLSRRSPHLPPQERRTMPDVAAAAAANMPTFAHAIHGAPLGSFVAHLALCMAQLATGRDMAQLWLEVVRQLRIHWRAGQPIPRLHIEQDNPDLRLCEVMQHLQLLNLCVARRKRRLAAASAAAAAAAPSSQSVPQDEAEEKAQGFQSMSSDSCCESSGAEGGCQDDSSLLPGCREGRKRRPMSIKVPSDPMGTSRLENCSSQVPSEDLPEAERIGEEALYGGEVAGASGAAAAATAAAAAAATPATVPSAVAGGRNPSPAMLVRLPDGSVAMRRGAKAPVQPPLMLLDRGGLMYEPVTADLPLVTESSLRESEELIMRTGTIGSGCKQLFSDMQAFKAANPGCILEDFVRWYSPPDWSPLPYSPTTPSPSSCPCPPRSPSYPDMHSSSSPAAAAAAAAAARPASQQAAEEPTGPSGASLSSSPPSSRLSSVGKLPLVPASSAESQTTSSPHLQQQQQQQQQQPLCAAQASPKVALAVAEGREGLRRHGYLSKRMTFTGNLWKELWQRAEAVPVSDQPPLFDEELAGENSLDWLERIAPADLLEQLFITLVGLGVCTAQTLPQADREPLKSLLVECGRYATGACGKGMSRKKMHFVCMVYETLLRAAVQTPAGAITDESSPEIPRHTSSMQEETADSCPSASISMAKADADKRTTVLPSPERPLTPTPSTAIADRVVDPPVTAPTSTMHPTAGMRATESHETDLEEPPQQQPMRHHPSSRSLPLAAASGPGSAAPASSTAAALEETVVEDYVDWLMPSPPSASDDDDDDDDDDSVASRSEASHGGMCQPDLDGSLQSCLPQVEEGDADWIIV